MSTAPARTTLDRRVFNFLYLFRRMPLPWVWKRHLQIVHDHYFWWPGVPRSCAQRLTVLQVFGIQPLSSPHFSLSPFPNPPKTRPSEGASCQRSKPRTSGNVSPNGVNEHITIKLLQAPSGSINTVKGHIKKEDRRFLPMGPLTPAPMWPISRSGQMIRSRAGWAVA